MAASCHCGAVTIRFDTAPKEVVECNCSLCRKYGVLWTYCSAEDIAFTPESPPTDTYAWNGKHVDFHRCSHCGCITHWMPRDAQRKSRGVNARLLPPEILAAARLRHKDGANTGKYLD